MHPHLSTELALKAFEANAALSAALAEFQKDPPTGSITEEARRAAGHGFSWFWRPSEPGFVEVRLRHAGGAELSAEGTNLADLLAGLLGLDPEAAFVAAPAQAAEPEQEGDLSPATRSALVEADAAIDALEAAADALLTKLKTSPAQVAAESLAAATGGAVVTEPSEYVPDPNELLTDAEKALAIKMISSLSAEQRKSFTISFRDAFKVHRGTKSIAPLITQRRHLRFCDDWSIEAAGGVAA
jgi:hypothetical protein